MDKIFLSRLAEKEILKLATYFPAVAIVGPRQVGKTSLVQNLRAKLLSPSLYLDLENPSDLIKLSDPSLFLEAYSDHTIILDEVQKLPSLFPELRGIIDRNRKPGRFILLGSASPDLIRDTSQSLAGRITYFELLPFTFAEVKNYADYKTHWLRGGFPDAVLAPDDEMSVLWRRSFIQTYLERDLPQLGLSADPLIISKLWRMLAHMSGDLLNMETLGRSLGIHGTTIRKYLDFLESAFLIRRLPPFHLNIKKRLVRSPKIYLRDTGILHQLLGISTFESLSGNPVLGASWETYALEQIYAILPPWAEMYFYRTYEGNEVDLVISRGGNPEILIELKYSTKPKLKRGFHIATEDLQTKTHFIVSPIDVGFPLSDKIQVIGISEVDRIFKGLE